MCVVHCMPSSSIPRSAVASARCYCHADLLHAAIATHARLSPSAEWRRRLTSSATALRSLTSDCTVMYDSSYDVISNGSAITNFDPCNGTIEFKVSAKLRLVWKGTWRRRPDPSGHTSAVVQRYFPHDGKYDAYGNLDPNAAVKKNPHSPVPKGAGAGSAAGRGGGGAGAGYTLSGGGGGGGGHHANAWASPPAVHTSYNGGGGGGGGGSQGKRAVAFDLRGSDNGDGGGFTIRQHDGGMQRATNRGSWHGRPSQHHSPRPGAKPKYPDSSAAIGGRHGGSGGHDGGGGSGGRDSSAGYYLASATPRLPSLCIDEGPSPSPQQQQQASLSPPPPFVSPSPQRGERGGRAGRDRDRGSGGGRLDVDAYAGGQYAVHDARGYNAYGQQRVSPFRLDQIMPRRYADDGGARSDGVGGRADSPTNVRARARLGRFVLQPGRSTQRLQQKDVASLKTTATTTLLSSTLLY